MLRNLGSTYGPTLRRLAACSGVKPMYAHSSSKNCCSHTAPPFAKRASVVSEFDTTGSPSKNAKPRGAFAPALGRDVERTVRRLRARWRRLTGGVGGLWPLAL